VPIVDADGVLAGVLTDRDLCMAVYTQGRTLSEIPVAAVMSQKLATCNPDDPLAAAEKTMQASQVHRLPVVDARGALVGVLAMSDLVRTAQARPAALDGQKVLATFAAIVAPRRAVAAAVAVPTPAAAPRARTAVVAEERAANAAAAAADKPAAKRSTRAAAKPAAAARGKKKKA
jgi:CBS-domain-containing membrane protein